MNVKKEINFKYPNKMGFILIWLELPLIGVLILAIAGVTGYWFYSLRTNPDGLFLDFLKGLVLLGVFTWMLASFIHWVSDRHAFVTSYMLSDSGISIKMYSGLEQQLIWSDFDCAIDSRTLRYIKIFSKKLEKPVTIVFGAPGHPLGDSTENYEMARNLVSSKLNVIKKYW